ncbi:MAG: tRNA (guanosine(37)-N1)-methyltransferase TrmD [Marinilabiliales bacterium]|nr:tRNA (guanosine(37)-N1)-methyltransferase TrmD [Marinilabiliales bacterium]
MRDYSTDRHKSVDDYQFGGGAGMVMMIEPVYNCITHLSHPLAGMTRSSTPLPTVPASAQPLANELSMKENIIILAGHYKGIDQRIRDHLVTREISIGDYVLTGGELPAAVITDAIVRLLPGAISDAGSALSDSFQDNLLAPPVYTRPAEFMGWKVPEILTGGNTPEIEKWRFEQSVRITRKKRPDLLGEES